MQLLPVVVGWLIISPRCEADKLQKALQEANAHFHIAQDDGLPYRIPTPLNNDGVENGPALLLKPVKTMLLRDEVHSLPVFNYARVFAWSSCADRVVEALIAASERAESRKSADSRPDTTLPRPETRTQVVAYCQHPHRTFTWGRGVFMRMAIASFMGLMLQWCTAGAAAMIILYSTSLRVGIGCRSGSYLLYALISTLVWFFMVSSSIIAYYCDTAPPRKPRSEDGPQYPSHPYLHELALSLNLLGKTLCVLNAFWIVCSCMLHFSNTFNRCVCNSGMWETRSAKESFAVLAYSRKHQEVTQYAWIGGIAVTLASAMVFVIFIWFKQQPPRRRNSSLKV